MSAIKTCAAMVGVALSLGANLAIAADPAPPAPTQA